MAEHIRSLQEIANLNKDLVLGDTTYSAVMSYIMVLRGQSGKVV